MRNKSRAEIRAIFARMGYLHKAKNFSVDIKPAVKMIWEPGVSWKLRSGRNIRDFVNKTVRDCLNSFPMLVRNTMHFNKVEVLHIIPSKEYGYLFGQYNPSGKGSVRISEDSSNFRDTLLHEMGHAFSEGINRAYQKAENNTDADKLTSKLWDGPNLLAYHGKRVNDYTWHYRGEPEEIFADCFKMYTSSRKTKMVLNRKAPKLKKWFDEVWSIGGKK